MPIAATTDLLRAAQAGGYGVPAFNVIGLEHAEAIMQAAEAEKAPVIFQISENAVKYHLGAVQPIGAACRALADAAAVPIALHLDHATGTELCRRAVAAGFSSVMLDTADLPYEENVRQTAELAAWARTQGAGVEAALGTVGGKEAARTTPAGMTDPEAAREFVAATAIDALAVAVGSSHYMTEQTARLDLALVARLRDAVDVPLVLHGSSGVPDDDLVGSVQRGIVKVNLATHVNKAFTTAVRDVLAANAAVVDPRRYLAAGREAVVEAARDRLRLLGASGRATEGGNR